MPICSPAAIWPTSKVSRKPAKMMLANKTRRHSTDKHRLKKLTISKNGQGSTHITRVVFGEYSPHAKPVRAPKYAIARIGQFFHNGPSHLHNRMARASSGISRRN